MAAGIEWFFDQLARLLEELDKMLAYRVDIPLLTRLYEQVIKKERWRLLPAYSLQPIRTIGSNPNHPNLQVGHGI